MKRIFLSFLLLFLFVNFAFGADNSILVNQPAYSSMNFYVYKPAGLHKDFYVTYDGYLVYKNSKGVWHYGSYDKNGIIRTGYVVGSVIPYVVKLKPYDAKISSVAPVLGSDNFEEIKSSGEKNKIFYVDSRPKTLPDINVTTNKTGKIIYTPPFPVVENKNLTPNATDWTQNSNFMSIGKWQKSVDRIGVLDRPRTPVAWKGDYPEVIFACTGLQWKQLSARSSHTAAMSTLRRENYALTVHTNKLNILRWDDEDTYVLSQYARMWGYQWLGQILIEREY